MGDGAGAMRVLLVDDDEDVRGLVRVILTRHGCGFQVVAEAAAGAEAILLARVHRPDVILLDAQMPGMPGDEALPHLLDVSPPPMVVGFSSMPESRKCFLRLGAFAWYTKEKAVSLPDLLRTDYENFRNEAAGLA